MTVHSILGANAGFNGFRNEEFITITQQTHDTLIGAEDLSPANEDINKCLSAFVSAVLNVSDDNVPDILGSARIQELRHGMLPRLSVAEFEMEKHFGQHFANAGAIHTTNLDEFWYRQCYKDLVQEEVDAGRSLGITFNEHSRICFVGSGPLPMTAIDMHLITGAQITCIDCDENAVELSSKMIENLGLSDVIHVSKSEACDVDYGQGDVIFVASLVANKKDVVAKIRETAPHAYVGVRSVEGIKAMLYEPVNHDAFTENGLTYLGSSQDTHGTINTTLFFKP